MLNTLPFTSHNEECNLLANRTAFLACSVQAISRRFGAAEMATDDLTTEDMRKQMTDKEWDKVSPYICLLYQLSCLIIKMNY